MNDPYSVLGVSPNASDDEIKKAYRELVRKYHPDNYHDNPLSELAQEKMKQVNEAYEQITRARDGGGTNRRGAQQSRPGGSYGGQSAGGGQYAQARAALNSGNLALAESLLNQAGDRNAEWHFLMGSLCYRKGWLDEAMRYYQIAVNMEPNNMEYRQAFQYMQGGGGFYRPTTGGFGRGVGGMDACDCCSSLLIADCCCECMGGDLIRCC